MVETQGVASSSGVRQSGDVERAEAQRLGPSARALPAVGILLATWLLMWLAQGIPTLCVLANACPAPDVRVAPALLFGGLMIVPTSVLILTSSGRSSWSGVRALFYIVLVGLAIVGLGAVLFSGGFTVPLMS